MLSRESQPSLGHGGAHTVSSHAMCAASKLGWRYRHQTSPQVETSQEKEQIKLTHHLFDHAHHVYCHRIALWLYVATSTPRCYCCAHSLTLRVPTAQHPPSCPALPLLDCQSHHWHPPSQSWAPSPPAPPVLPAALHPKAGSLLLPSASPPISRLSPPQQPHCAAECSLSGTDCQTCQFI